MYVVTKFSTGKVHNTESKSSFRTLCGKNCVSGRVNDSNNGFSDIQDTDRILNVPEVTCKKCLEIYNK